ncbi:MAG: deoxynucleoside kinase [Bacteroidales bacterium]|jgi:deoxyadenosine/deoxycytidine kinase|nr:deoxynucleoside kinase [Bacteroidales bacterium]
MHVAIAGNIGSGKTTLTGLLAKHYGWDAHYENADDNPYLDDFYEDMPHWSFNLQIYFLNERYGQIQEIRNSGLDVVQDRTIYEDAYIFAANLHSMGLMSMRDYTTYRSLFEKMSVFIQPPDLLIYLRASVPTLVRQIQKRGRAYESGIRLDYLGKLNDSYEKWINSYILGKILTVNVDEIQFDEKPEDLHTVINRIDAQIHGLFNK